MYNIDINNFIFRVDYHVTIQACLIYASLKSMTWQQPGFYANSVDISSTDNM
jgi:hypothetical protein